MTIGDRIKTTRKAMGMTQTELGKKCGVTKQAIFKYENDIITNIPLDKIQMIARALNVSAAWIMGWKTQDRGIDIGIAQMEAGLSEEEIVSYIEDKKVSLFTLSPDEQGLITDYRRLSHSGKEYILQTMAIQSYLGENNIFPNLGKSELNRRS